MAILSSKAFLSTDLHPKERGTVCLFKNPAIYKKLNQPLNRKRKENRTRCDSSYKD